jgi:hypothetical protein
MGFHLVKGTTEEEARIMLAVLLRVYMRKW